MSCEATAMPAPGMMKEHYSPRTPLRLHRSESAPPLPKRSGRIAFQALDPLESARYVVVETLSESGDLDEVARGLFAALRRLDQAELDLIVVDTCDPTGIGRAIMDRLHRAAAPGAA
ncbi:MAG: Sua5 family C-terminal domain-containing protein [Novipirellula sp. JB048]